MGSRERKRAARRRRKARSRGREATQGAETERIAASAAAAGVEPEPSPSTMERGYAKAEERNRQAREALEPLGEDERPLVVTIGAAISAIVSVSILIGYASGAEVGGDRPELLQVLAPALLTAIMAWGMWRARYWAVLGFQTILLFLIAAAAFALALRSLSVVQIVANLLLLAVAGTFFALMVKAMARIQMPHRLPRD